MHLARLLSTNDFSKNLTVYLDETGNVNISPQDMDGGSIDLSGISSYTASKIAYSREDIGNNEVILTVTDAYENAVSGTSTITVGNNTDVSGAIVNFDISASDNCGISFIQSTPASGSEFTNGNTTVNILVTDHSGNKTALSFEVIGIDSEVPVIHLTTESISMWPPNHEYQNFDVSDFVGSVSDNCLDLSIDNILTLSVSSDEADNGQRDDNTTEDIVIGANCKFVDLRKERAGSGDGRVYTIELAFYEENHNISLEQVRVTVPKNNNSPAADNGLMYSVGSHCTAIPAGKMSINESDVTSNDYQHKLGVFPNPVTQNFTIDFGELGTVQVLIHNRLGALVYEKTVSESILQLSKGNSFRSGVYIITPIDQFGDKYYQKLIID